MAVYAIGDLQGCDREFVALLERLDFSAEDELWLVGDLINRGPDSLATLRRVRALGERCILVLGNHDLHFLAAYFGRRAPNRGDTFDELLAAPDVDELAHWLRRQKLLHLDLDRGWVMTMLVSRTSGVWIKRYTSRARWNACWQAGMQRSAT